MKKAFVVKDLSTEKGLHITIKEMSEGRASTVVWSSGGLYFESIEEVLEWLQKNLKPLS